MALPSHVVYSRQDKTRQNIYFSDPQIKNIKYIQIIMYDSYWGGNEGSSIILNRLSRMSTCYPAMEGNRSGLQ